MFLSAYLVLVVSQPVPDGFVPQNTAEHMTFSLKQGSGGWTFDWADTEDRVRGTLTPSELSSGDPIVVSVAVGSFEGNDFNGPVTLTLKQLSRSRSERRNARAAERDAA